MNFPEELVPDVQILICGGVKVSLSKDFFVFFQKEHNSFLNYLLAKSHFTHQNICSLARVNKTLQLKKHIKKIFYVRKVEKLKKLGGDELLGTL